MVATLVRQRAIWPVFFTHSNLENLNKRDMKKNIYLYTLLTAVFCATAISCDKSIEITEQLTPLTPAKMDADAGTWKMAFMSAPDQIAVPAPAAQVGSDAYN